LNEIRFSADQLEGNAVNFFKGRMINRGAWKDDDAGWMARRGQEWEHLRPRMEYLQTPKRKLKQYESYFMTGKLPRAHPYEDEPAICLFYLLWWHPDRSDENWHEIRETIRHIGSNVQLFEEYPLFWTQHYEASKAAFLVGAGRWSNMAPDEGFRGGFMDGLEERMLNFLIDVDAIDASLMIYGMSPAFWLREDDSRSNPHALYQYDKFINRWYDCVSSGQHDQYLKDERRRTSILEFLNAVAEFPLDQRKPDHFKAVFVRKIRGILDNQPLPDEFRKLWREIRQSVDGDGDGDGNDPF